jgi:site-specific recombinase XerD
VKQPDAFASPIAPLIVRYLAVKRALGRRATSLTYTLRYLDRFLVSSGAADLTRESFRAWSESMASLSGTSRRARLRAAYYLCLFRRREDLGAFVPDPTQFPPQGPRPLPYIFSEADIARSIVVAGEMAPHKASPLCREVARISLVILYTAGLRRGELVRLTMGDYEETDRVLHVRQTKFDKSRLVPLSADAVEELQRYLVARRRAGAPCQPDVPLLVHNHGARFRGYTGAGLGQLLKDVIRKAGIRTSCGRAPRIHDLRFSFAVQALLRWYRAGVDVQTRLPALATYLGHVSVVSTQYYLIFMAATAEAAGERFRNHSATWLSPVTGGGGSR